MSVQDIVPVHLIDINIFQWTKQNFDLVVVLDEKSGGHQSQWDSYIVFVAATSVVAHAL